MNKTKIEYAGWTWNPITGCRIRCGDYCYAKKLVKRWGLYGGSFAPQFHPRQLEPNGSENNPRAPIDRKRPSVIFVCDMGDIFTPGVEEAWRRIVKKAAEKAPWHTYLWLTKNPKYDESWIKPNWWLGATITGPEESYKRRVLVGENVWYSYEPLFGCSDDEDVWDAKQIVIGRATNHKAEWRDAWAEHLTDIYQRSGTKVFWKSNIGKAGPRELVWSV